MRFRLQAGFISGDGVLNGRSLLFVLADMSAITRDPGGQLPADIDAAIRQLFCRHAEALHVYVERFCTDRTSADDVVQETFIRAWRHLPKLSADDQIGRAHV